MSTKSQEAGIHFLREQRYPFIRLVSLGTKPVDADVFFDKYTKNISITGWLVKYWPEDELTPATVACSPYDPYESGALDKEMCFNPSSDIPVPPSDRNMSTQCFKTAGEVVLMVLEQGWTGVKIIEGSELMKWCMWAMCRTNGLTCEGYEPNDENDAMGRYNRSESLLQAYDQRQPSFDASLILSSSSGGDENNDDVVPFDFPEITNFEDQSEEDK
ncbi:MAG: hypothetical protein VX835_01340 [Pseudomonadota bacterium]|nr:hypothetical protein [Pseudomonadota bacterium]